MADVSASSSDERQATILVKVKTMAPATHEVRVSPAIELEGLKSILAELTSIPVERQRLIYRGHQMRDSQTLTQHGVEDGHTLHLVERLVGPAPPAAAQPQANTGAAGGQAASAAGMGMPEGAWQQAFGALSAAFPMGAIPMGTVRITSTGPGDAVGMMAIGQTSSGAPPPAGPPRPLLLAITQHLEALEEGQPGDWEVPGRWDGQRIDPEINEREWIEAAQSVLEGVNLPEETAQFIAEAFPPRPAQDNTATPPPPRPLGDPATTPAVASLLGITLGHLLDRLVTQLEGYTLPVLSAAALQLHRISAPVNEMSAADPDGWSEAVNEVFQARAQLNALCPLFWDLQQLHSTVINALEGGSLMALRTCPAFFNHSEEESGEESATMPPAVDAGAPVNLQLPPVFPFNISMNNAATAMGAPAAGAGQNPGLQTAHQAMQMQEQFALLIHQLQQQQGQQQQQGPPPPHPQPQQQQTNVPAAEGLAAAGGNQLPGVTVGPSSISWVLPAGGTATANFAGPAPDPALFFRQLQQAYGGALPPGALAPASFRAQQQPQQHQVANGAAPGGPVPPAAQSAQHAALQQQQMQWQQQQWQHHLRQQQAAMRQRAAGGAGQPPRSQPPGPQPVAPSLQQSQAGQAAQVQHTGGGVWLGPQVIVNGVPLQANNQQVQQFLNSIMGGVGAAAAAAAANAPTGAADNLNQAATAAATAQIQQLMGSFLGNLGLVGGAQQQPGQGQGQGQGQNQAHAQAQHQDGAAAAAQPPMQQILSAVLGGLFGQPGVAQGATGQPPAPGAQPAAGPQPSAAQQPGAQQQQEQPSIQLQFSRLLDGYAWTSDGTAAMTNTIPPSSAAPPTSPAPSRAQTALASGHQPDGASGAAARAGQGPEPGTGAAAVSGSALAAALTAVVRAAAPALVRSMTSLYRAERRNGVTAAETTIQAAVRAALEAALGRPLEAALPAALAPLLPNLVFLVDQQLEAQNSAPMPEAGATAGHGAPAAAQPTVAATAGAATRVGDSAAASAGGGDEYVTTTTITADITFAPISGPIQGAAVAASMAPFAPSSAVLPSAASTMPRPTTTAPLEGPAVVSSGGAAETQQTVPSAAAPSNPPLASPATAAAARGPVAPSPGPGLAQLLVSSDAAPGSTAPAVSNGGLAELLIDTHSSPSASGTAGVTDAQPTTSGDTAAAALPQGAAKQLPAVSTASASGDSSSTTAKQVSASQQQPAEAETEGLEGTRSSSRSPAKGLGRGLPGLPKRPAQARRPPRTPAPSSSTGLAAPAAPSSPAQDDLPAGTPTPSAAAFNVDPSPGATPDRGSGGAGSLVNMLGSLMGGTGAAGTGAGGGIGQVLAQVTSSPEFQRMAASPQLQRMADQMFGGTGGGGGGAAAVDGRAAAGGQGQPDLGALMSQMMPMMGQLLGGSGGRADTAGNGQAPTSDTQGEGTDLWEMLKAELPEEEAARWENVILADRSMMSSSAAAAAERPPLSAVYKAGQIGQSGGEGGGGGSALRL